ncbi:MAG TPA: TRAP transporter substrate-binding protein DctP [Polyangia bacterium]|jgi:TRAP-type C4-dicarboxylate transport system substrate-binding protein
MIATTMRAIVAIGIVAATAATARAEGAPVLLRMATAAPEGTAWAREGHSFERDVAELTHGQVRMKWYLGGIAGNELQMLERIKREQLDGVASAGMLCAKLAPSMRALRIVGLFQSRDESAFVSGRLKDTFDEELLHAGFVNLGEMGIGPDIIFSNTPLTSFEDLKKTRMWIWDLDDVFREQLTAMGLTLVPRPLETAFSDREHGMFDGFIAVPTAALAFQWSTQVHYFTELRPSFLRGCILIASRAFDQLSVEGQRSVRQAAARTIARMEVIGREQDDALLGGLFAKQGVKHVPVSEFFRAEFFATAQAARERLGDKLVAHSLLLRVLGMLADYRAVHRGVEER